MSKPRENFKKNNEEGAIMSKSREDLMGKSRQEIEDELYEKAKPVLSEVVSTMYSLGLNRDGVDQASDALNLLRKVGRDTQEVTKKPTKEGLEEYKKLQEQVSKHPKMQKLGAAMLIFVGVLVEVVVFIPNVVKSNLTDKGYYGNEILKTGSALFKKGSIASRMKEHHEKLENEPEVKSANIRKV